MPFATRVVELFEAVAAAGRAVLPLGPLAGVPPALVGVVALTMGTRNGRVLGVAGGAAVGAAAGFLLRRWLAAHLAVSPSASAVTLAAAGAALGGAFPRAFPFAAAALPGALVGAEVPLAGRSVLGAAAGAIVAGVAGLALSRLVAIAFASLCGGGLLGLGLLAAFGATPLARELAERPAALVGFAVVLAVAGAAFQLARGPAAPADRSPESPP